MYGAGKEYAGGPPPYCASAASASIRPGIPCSSPSQPTNFLYIVKSQWDVGKKSYIIDPSLPIPDAYLEVPTGAVKGGVKRNAYFHASSGDMDVDLWIVGRKNSETMPGKRTTLYVKADCGSVSFKINAIDNIHPFTLEITARRFITVLIPRSFHGMVSVPGQSGISNEVLKHSACLGEVSNERIFVGDISAVTGSDSGSTGWEPDELIVKGSKVTIKYVD